MQLKQELSEPIWRYFEHFNDLLAQCHHHGIEKWWQYRILYDDLDYQTKTLLENMFQGDSCKRMKTKGEIYLRI